MNVVDFIASHGRLLQFTAYIYTCVFSLMHDDVLVGKKGFKTTDVMKLKIWINPAIYM